jgi:alkanesulfonate monooxygenase SsuD/methylene tetrahydromethanopterin reductase-like flavin-dependent oxidoreductase (luciferase family)
VKPVQYGFVIPGGDARDVADLARSAEQAGWDGVFVAETVWGVDAWVSLTAAAMVTERIRLGTLLSPVSRMRPWKLASETATLDRLCNGRVTLSVGLGALDTGFAEFGEVTDRKTRAALLDEGLDILTGLWRGQPFSYDGTHYQIRPTSFFPPPPPVQQPRIPIWVSAAWPKPISLARALRYDGLLPVVIRDEGARKPTIDEVREMRGYVDRERGEATTFDIVVEGETPGDDIKASRAIVAPWADAGATWWIEALWDAAFDDAKAGEVRLRVEQGPPK